MRLSCFSAEHMLRFIVSDGEKRLRDSNYWESFGTTYTQPSFSQRTEVLLRLTTPHLGAEAVNG